MKNLKITFLLVLVLLSALLMSCSGSDIYQGEWKATDLDGNKLEINFEPKRFTITSDGHSKSYDYTQNSVKVQNSIKSYGIQIGDGRAYTILFPIKGEASKAVMLIDDSQILYTMSRDAYITNEEMNRLD